MWTEPLRAAVTRTHRSMFVTSVLDASDQLVAHVTCSISVEARCGYFGGMIIDDASGAPRQKARAMVLLVRRSLTYAAELGLQLVETDLPRDAKPSLRSFAARMSGLPTDDKQGIGGHLADILSHNLNATNEDGTEK